MIFSPSFLTGLALLQSEHHLPLPSIQVGASSSITNQAYSYSFLDTCSALPQYITNATQLPLQNYSHVSAKPHSVQLI
jgi:hypothetical protein